MFQHYFVDLPHLEQLNTLNGRFYETPGGDRFPSATTIIGTMSDKGWLDDWRNRIGHAEAEKITAQAGNRGTRLHHMCEQYLLNTPVDMKQETPFAKHLFNQLRPHLDMIDKIKALEARMYSFKHKISGTVDCIGYYKAQRAVIDFKTSIGFKELSDIEGYFIQCAMYALMWHYLTGQGCPKLVVMIAVENSFTPGIFVQNTVDWIGPAKKMIKDYYEEIESA